MKKRLSNRSEARLHSEISDAVAEFGAGIYRKVRVADVINIDRLPQRQLGTYALQSHFDICVVDDNELPAFAIEFDGAGHNPSKDHLKNAIAREADLALFRVDETLVARTCGGMTFLQYLVHLWFMGAAFKRMQDAGELDASEPFMMSGFLKADAKHIFDSHYDFVRPPLRRIGKLLVKAGLVKPPLTQAMMGISHVILGRGDTCFVAFARMPFGSAMLHGRAKLTIGTPSLGELGELPFGWAGLADFCEGMVFDDLGDNITMELSQGSHATLLLQDIVEEMATLKADGFSLVRGSGSPDNMLSDLFR